MTVATGLVSVRHTRRIPILTQGDIGSCTANAALGCLGTDPFYDTIPADNPFRPTDNDVLDESLAVAFYTKETSVDRFPGTYPAQDTGSDGDAAGTVAKSLGLISDYRTTSSLASVLAALARVPVICGVTWYSSFDTPDESGQVKIAPGATGRGGHEFVLDELDVERKLIGASNSWGPDWGQAGRFYISWDLFGGLLLLGGNVTEFVPLR